MREEKQFVRFMVALAFMFFGIAKGIPAIVILAIPEPLPKLSRVTEVALVEAWEGPGDFRQDQLLQELYHTTNRLSADAELTFLGIAQVAACGRAQYDYDPILERMMPVSADRLQ